jgi:aminopeptidase N
LHTTWRFRKAGTEDVKAAFEAASHRSLGRFFDRWIYDDKLPHLRFGYRIDSNDVIVRFEQVGEIFDVPITVTLDYAGSVAPVDVIVPLSGEITEQRIPLHGVLKNVDPNSDNAAPVIFVK